MRKKLLLLLAVTSSAFSIPLSEPLEDERVTIYNSVIDEFISPKSKDLHAQIPLDPLYEIKEMLYKENAGLNTAVINKVLITLNCTNEYKVGHNNILTIIDYSLPSSEKRLWVFDLKEKKLLFHTYVSHGIKSGTLLSTWFSNKYDSKASSIGVYHTEKSYYGREGLSLRLEGLDKGFNDNAFNRYIVMHGGWYVNENFIKKYGRPGRSWGCPAVPLAESKPIINTIKDNSLFIVYYPSDNWLLKSRFLNCSMFSARQNANAVQDEIKPVFEENEIRDDILFADLNKNNKREENEPIIVMTADNYERVFQVKTPLNRMLRRRINGTEYIALSNIEFNRITILDKLISKNLNLLQAPSLLTGIYFVIPEVKMVRGNWVTQMNIVNMGNIEDVRPVVNSPEKLDESKNYTIYFAKKPVVNLKSTNRFIRWLGL
ncbi:MAG: murein L,D-transpeptidase catalytic domain family protein [Legionella sp.]|nr:murein L,D-transpeptidase catalytic domain family protein [Legionella sp.]